MSTQQLEKPPPYVASSTNDLQLPDAPSHDPSTTQQQEPGILVTSSGQLPQLTATIPAGDRNSTPSLGLDKKILLQPLDLPDVPRSVPGDGRITSDGDITMSEDRATPKARDASVSLEDPDDRMAAEALLGIGKSEPARSPRTGFETPLKYYPADVNHIHNGPQSQQSEPLLSLITSSHPWLGGTLSGSVSAYSSTKSYTPRFIQYGADIVENTVGNVGRRTGVENGLRRYLGSRRPSELEKLDPALALQAKAEPSDSDKAAINPEQGEATIQRSSTRSSMDSLPAYDENRSPAYEETTPRSSSQDLVNRTLRPPINRSWSKQLMISTSGLGAALNEASLKSLKFVLSILNSANKHVRNVMDALKQLLQDYAGTGKSVEDGASTEKDAMDIDEKAPISKESAVIAERIRQLNAEIWQTLKSVVDTVSTYTGGALPENASVVVRWQLLSIPQRWRHVVQRTGTPEKGNQDSDDAVASANRMIAFAIEGLDMMEQVGGVVDSTITSAERWLESMGRKKPEQSGESSSQASTLPAEKTEQGP